MVHFSIAFDINEAYETVMEYCENFEYPFDEESIRQATITPEEWWHSKFGQDPKKP